MGSACSCYLSYKQSDLLRQELSSKPFNATLIGKSPLEEAFIDFNTSLHLTNFSISFLKSKPESAFSTLKVPKSCDKIQVYSQSSLPKTFPEEVLFEGELEKFKPNSSSSYVSRWCRVTSNVFSYYKNRWSTFQSPLYHVPLAMVSRVRVIENRIQKNNPESFEFELVLVEDEELVKRSRNTTRDVSSPCFFDEEILVGTKKLVFGTKDFLVFQAWLKVLKGLIKNEG
jgi:hypothetical protein